jgi:hypothetical protein
VFFLFRFNDGGRSINSPQTLLQGFLLLRCDQINLVQENLVGKASTFPGSNVILAATPLSIWYPLEYKNYVQDENPHSLSEELSFNDSIRFGHIYNC